MKILDAFCDVDEPVTKQVWANIGRIIFLQKRRKKNAYYQGPVGLEEEDLFVEVVEQSNPVQMMFGTLVLWMGWYGFNGGSTLSVSDDLDLQASKVS